MFLKQLFIFVSSWELDNDDDDDGEEIVNK